MRKVDDGGEKKKKKEKRMAFLVATTSLPAVYHLNSYARTTTAGTLHARANKSSIGMKSDQMRGKELYPNSDCYLYIFLL